MVYPCLGCPRIICAGDKLVLTCRRGGGLKFPSRFRLGNKHEKQTRPYHSLDEKPRQLPSDIVCVPLRSFWNVIDGMKYFLSRDFMQVGTQLVRFGGNPFYTTPDARAAIEAADSLHPRFFEGNTLQQDMRMYGKGHYGNRPTTNAAGALTLLKHRHCYQDSDRLAIVANMCDYDFRLDTQATGRNCSSLRQAILALALNNADTSLLVPEVYLYKIDEIPNTDQHIQSGDSCFFAEILNDSLRIEHCMVRNMMNFKLQTIRPGWVTPAGLQIHAYIWSVGTFANFAPIQGKWADKWDSLKCWRFTVDRLKHETQKQFHSRHLAITRRFSEPGVSELASLEFKVAGHIPDESVIWRDIDNTGVHVSRYLDSRRVKGLPAMRDILVRILFDILRCATMSLPNTKHAQALADTLWHSIRVDQAPGSVQNFQIRSAKLYFRTKTS